MNHKRELFSLEQLIFISNLIIWGTFLGGLLIWLCMPWEVPVYHTGNVYYDGSKLPLLIFLGFPFFSYMVRIPEVEIHGDSQESKEIERTEKKKSLSVRICTATLMAIIVIVSLAVILGVSR